MKINILIGAMALLAGSVFAADSSLKDDVKAAAKKLGDNYTWKGSVENAGGGGFGAGPSEGKTASGTTWLSIKRRDTTSEAVLTGSKGALKTQDGWQSLSDAAKDDGGGGFNPTRFLAMRLQSYKLPAAEAADLADKAKELKKDGDAISGDLTTEGAKSLLAFRPPGGGDGPEISNPKGSVKFWLKDGALTKYEFNVQGTVSFGGNDREVNRTTTMEIKEVGSTKVEVPEEAKKKLT
jgi:hypothetical protein